MSIIEQDCISVDISLILASIRQSIIDSEISLLWHTLTQTGYKIQNYVDPELCKSMTGYFTLMTYRVTSWMSHQQKTVALFSTKAEYMALSNCGCQLIWTRSLLNEVGFNVPTSHIYGNNLGLLF